MKGIGNRLKDLRQKSGKTQEEIAQILRNMEVKADRSILARWENDIQKPTLPKLQALARIYNTTTDFILDGEEPENNSSSKSIPILGTIAAGQPLYAEQNIEDYLSVPRSWDVDFALMVKGDSMIDAHIKNGAVAFCRKQEDVNDGQIAVCIVDGDSATLKRVKRYGDILVLHPENTNYEDQVFQGKEKNLVRIIGLCKSVLCHVD